MNLRQLNMDISFNLTARRVAGIIAFVAWVGLIVQFDASSEQAGPPLATIWSMVRYFTILTNLTLAIVFTGVALGKPGFCSASLLGGVTLAILLVGVIFSLLLSATHVPVGIARISNFLLHYVTPVLTPLYWLAFAPKGALRRHHPLIWAIFPLVYLAYALLRGEIEGHYPYEFIDVTLIGWIQVAINAAWISLGFMLVAYGLVGLDRRLGGMRASPEIETRAGPG